MHHFHQTIPVATPISIPLSWKTASRSKAKPRGYAVLQHKWLWQKYQDSVKICQMRDPTLDQNCEIVVWAYFVNFLTGVTVCYSSRHTHLIFVVCTGLQLQGPDRPSFSDSPRLTDGPWPPWYSRRNSWVQGKNWAPSKRSTKYV